jgi:hypothetical protein
MMFRFARSIFRRGVHGGSQISLAARAAARSHQHVRKFQNPTAFVRAEQLAADIQMQAAIQRLEARMMEKLKRSSDNKVSSNTPILSAMKDEATEARAHLMSDEWVASAKFSTIVDILNRADWNPSEIEEWFSSRKLEFRYQYTCNQFLLSMRPLSKCSLQTEKKETFDEGLQRLESQVASLTKIVSEQSDKITQMKRDCLRCRFTASDSYDH